MNSDEKHGVNIIHREEGSLHAIHMYEDVCGVHNVNITWGEGNVLCVDVNEEIKKIMGILENVEIELRNLHVSLNIKD